MSTKAEQIAELIKGSGHTIIFTGAGASTEAGIPDFRSPGGIWTKYDPRVLDINYILSSDEAKREYWKFNKELGKMTEGSEPGDTHKIIAQLESKNLVNTIITQNIDALHEKAGSRSENILELHGNAANVICMKCKEECSISEILKRLQDEDIPRCENCGGILKVDFVCFGEQLPADVLNRAFEESSACDLFIVIGSSLVVNPAAQLPYVAKANGAKLVIINLSDTPLDSYADVLWNVECDKALSEVKEALDLE